MARRAKNKTVPIIRAKTIAEFVVAVNADYGLDIPESWPGGSALAAIWALPVSVAELADGYIATATKGYPTIGMPSTGLTGQLSATISSNSRFHLRNAIGDEQLDIETLNLLKKKET